MAKKRSSEAAQESGMVSAPATMKPEIVVFKITGRSPLLQNNPADFIGQDDGGGMSTGKKQYVDAEEASRRLYRDPSGAYCHPSNAFTRAMVKAVAGKKFGKSFATNIIKGAVFIVEPHALLTDGTGAPLTEYTMDRRPVVVGKSRVLRVRPCFSNWKCLLPLEVDTAILQPQQCLEALTLAGRIIGIGDYRPERGGGFGRFTAEIAN